ncbi:phytochrome A-associated F-box protein-like [Carex rostrata]
MAILSRFPRLKFLLNCFSDSSEAPSPISILPDDLLLKIFSLIPPADDPGLLLRLSGVSRHFRRLLLSPLPSSLSLHKLTICCPGILHAGILVPYYPDFYRSDFEKLYLESSNDLSEALDTVPSDSSSNQSQNFTALSSYEKKKKNGRRRKWMGPTGSHTATGNWSLSLEEGNKVLASVFRDDSLYICEEPGCVHEEENRKFKLFRGVFKDFNKTKVWKRIQDHNWMKVKLNCVYCECNEMWNLSMGGCLNNNESSHEDDLPLLQAFVCNNGHVSGAWKDEKPWTIEDAIPGSPYYMAAKACWR